MPRYIKNITLTGFPPPLGLPAEWSVVVGEFVLDNGRIATLPDLQISLQRALDQFGSVSAMIDSMALPEVNKITNLRNQRDILRAEVDALLAQKVQLLSEAEAVKGSSETVIPPE